MTTTLNGKANLTGATFTGNVSVVGGSYGAWAQAPLNAVSYNTGNQTMTWATLTNSNNITRAANTNSFQVSQAGTYVISCYIHISTIAAGAFQLIGRSSTNNSTWSNVLVSTGSGAYLASSTMTMQGIYTMAASSYFDIMIYNQTGGIATLYATTPNSYFHMYRTG